MLNIRILVIIKFSVFILLLLGTMLAIYSLPQPSAPLFVTPTQTLISITKSNSNLKSKKPRQIFESQIIPQPEFLAAAHSSAFEVLSDGSLLAFWFAGSHEGKPDVKIWSAKFINNTWRLATVAVSPEMLSKHLNQFIKKVGNPVVYRDENDRLHLFVVSVGAVGGWSGSSLNQLISYDNGLTWTVVRKLILSPFLNISTLVRTKAIDLKDGGFYLPVYNELEGSYPELLRFNRQGEFMEQIRMANTRTLLQPAIAVQSESIAYAFMRNKINKSDPLYMQVTNDAGITWDQPLATNLTNHDSSLAVTYLGNRQLLMVHNPGEDRSKLALSVSKDGYHWQMVTLLENTPGMEFSYPAVQVHSGMIDVLYTWDRKQIKHVRFNESWLGVAIGIKHMLKLEI
jgi:predicted neuraminidase